MPNSTKIQQVEFFKDILLPQVQLSWLIIFYLERCCANSNTSKELQIHFLYLSAQPATTPTFRSLHKQLQIPLKKELLTTFSSIQRNLSVKFNVKIKTSFTKGWIPNHLPRIQGI